MPRMRQVGEGASPRLDTQLVCGISQPKFKGPTEKLWLARCERARFENGPSFDQAFVGGDEIHNRGLLIKRTG